MKKFLIITILMCLLSPFVKAQMYLNDAVPNVYHFGRHNLTLDDIQGSPYLDFEFKLGTILTDDGGLYKDIPLRYNCYDDVLEFKKDNDSYSFMPKSRIKRAEFGGQVFMYKDLESEGGANKSYFQVLAEGKATLLARFKVVFYEAEELKGFADAKPPRFDNMSETYYVSLNNAPARKIANNKKLIEILGNKQKEVETFISKQRLSTKKVDDLKKIITYYNSL